MRKVLIYYDFPEAALMGLKEKYKDFSFSVYSERNEVLHDIEDAEILISNEIDKEMLDNAKRLKWIQAMIAGVDGLPLESMGMKGIILTNVRGVHRIQMSEYAIWAMISMAVNSSIMFKNQMSSKWEKQVPQDEIYGSTAGILGLGSIGREIAKKASLMGMHVIGMKSSSCRIDFVDTVYGEDEMAEVFKNSDYVINLLPHTQKTDGLINKYYFSLMKKTACFINMSRGRTVNEDDLVDALSNKRIKGMVSDVFYIEPLPESSPLWKMDNVIITPHISGVTPKYVDRAMEIIEHNMDAYLGSGKMMNLIDLKKGY